MYIETYIIILGTVIIIIPIISIFSRYYSYTPSAVRTMVRHISRRQIYGWKIPT
jgi:hypothetical protein